MSNKEVYKKENIVMKAILWNFIENNALPNRLLNRLPLHFLIYQAKNA